MPRSAADVTQRAKLVAAALRRHQLRDLVFFTVNEVHIEQLGVFGDVAVVGFGFVAVLDEVIPASPFPNNFTGRLAGRLDLDQAIGLQMRIFHGLGPTAFGDGFFFINHLPANE